MRCGCTRSISGNASQSHVVASRALRGQSSPGRSSTDSWPYRRRSARPSTSPTALARFGARRPPADQRVVAVPAARAQDGAVRAFAGSVPLSLDEVEGWRAWSVVERDGAYVLSSLTRAEAWEPGQPFAAACTRTRHEAPGRRCSCGVYAAADPNELARLGRIAGAAIGQASLWGRLVEHSRGYRAAAAYPTRLRLVCVACLSDGRGEPAAVVDRDTSGERARLRPLCETHAGSASLPSARPL